MERNFLPRAVKMRDALLFWLVALKNNKDIVNRLMEEPPKEPLEDFNKRIKSYEDACDCCRRAIKSLKENFEEVD